MSMMQPLTPEPAAMSTEEPAMVSSQEPALISTEEPATIPQTIYLVTGANRGLGLGFCSDLLQRPNTTVIAAVRNPLKIDALLKLPVAEGSKLLFTKLDSMVASDAQEAIDDLQTRHEIDRLDVVIANAGIEKWFGPAARIPLSELRDHFEVNAMAPLALFQAAWPLLQQSSNPKFVPISSRLGSMTEIAKVKNPAAAYGASKAMLNYLTCRMHFENPTLTAFPMSPG